MSSDSDPEIDFEHLNQYVGGDTSLTAEVFGLFQNQVEIWGKALTVDADDEIWTAVTHSLKGTANAVGAKGLAALCKKAEGLVGERDKPGAREYYIQNIEFKISRVIAEIQRWEYRRKIDAMRGD